ncbi:MAG: PEP-CTERM sorting domain-containing protein [Pirellulales bacterium]|nr:PEP-CTERM sorting domain-containing protein [Pirellulales bacterium]
MVRFQLFAFTVVLIALFILSGEVTRADLITSSLFVQLDADSTSNFVLNGSAVNVWIDKATDGSEGTHQDFGNNAAANQPALVTGVTMPNGAVRNVVDFTRGAISSSSSNSSTTSSDFLVSKVGGASGAFSPGGDAAYSPGGTAGADGLSWFMVFKSDIITHPVGSSNRHRQARQTLLVSNTSDTAIVNTMTAAMTEGGTTDPDVSLYSAGRDSLGIQSAYETGDAEGALTANWYILGTSWDLDSGVLVSRIFQQDGTDTGYVTHSVNAAWTTALPVNTETIIGQRFSTAVNGTNYAFDGQMAEVLIYHAALNQTDMTTVVDYLNQKYFVIPEPSISIMLGCAGIGLALFLRRRR